MTTRMESHRHRIKELAEIHRRQDAAFAEWAAGYGVIRHEDATQVRIYDMADLLQQRGAVREKAEVYRCLAAADRLASAAMWLTVHMTYARNVYLDGRDLAEEDFKPEPEGHTGGALNMAPAYAGYLAVNALTGITRAWMMGQGHCVAAIDALNLLVDNMSAVHAARYGLSDEGLTRLVRDFYSYEVRADGRPASPLGSHVNPNTAGGMLEGGYLGFAELQYVHMPLPGERLVVFLSDGAFEEQRGSDWAPRWWRAEDSGLVAPIMIANGRRIDQRTTMSQEGGVHWFREHLRLNGFDPIDLDGRDPAAFAWGVFEMEERLQSLDKAVAAREATYPVPLPYAIAEAPKGYGFPGAGTNRAHNLPLAGNPARDAAARGEFNGGARALWVPLPELRQAAQALNRHDAQRRVKERAHPLIARPCAVPAFPDADWRKEGEQVSPMAALDDYFCRLLKANPALRPRVGNPDEMRSNRLNVTLDYLKHRVTSPEAGGAEAVNGGVITALNEEAVVNAALANKGGINLVASYEAFAVKMLGAIRQELIFARHQADAGDAPCWLALPVVLTSHTWENGKNEQSHQDPTLSEALLGEMNDVSRVVFPADGNSAVATLRALYASRGQIWSLIVPKRDLPMYCDRRQAQQMVSEGALTLRDEGADDGKLLLIAVGAYQLQEAVRAADRLRARGVAHRVVYVYEPGRFRVPRDEREAAYAARGELRERLFPAKAKARVILSHTRPEPLLGALRVLDSGPATTRALGYINRGGTLDVGGMLFANRCTWAHALDAAASCLNRPVQEWLSPEELAAIQGEGDPRLVMRAPA